MWEALVKMVEVIQHAAALLFQCGTMLTYDTNFETQHMLLPQVYFKGQMQMVHQHILTMRKHKKYRIA